MKAILSTGLRKVTLDAPLSNSDTDTDKDGLHDWDEVDTKSKLIKWGEDGSIILPTFKECIDKKGEELFYVKEGLDRYFMESNSYTEQVMGELYSTKVLPIISDPTNEDSNKLTDDKDNTSIENPEIMFMDFSKSIKPTCDNKCQSCKDYFKRVADKYNLSWGKWGD